MKEEVRKHIHNKVRHPFFLPHLLVNVRNKSHESHSNYIEVIEGLAVAIRGNLEALNLIKKTDTNNQKNFWQKFKGEKLFGFIDGGSTDINIPSAAPMGIRVACYLVSPGRRGKDREDFDYVIQMVDELYDSVYFDDFSPNISQMKDSSRIMCETAGCVNVLENVKEIDSIFLHGPLVNPVSPYGASQSSIPPYSKEAITKFMPHLDPENLSPHNLAKEEERRHFIPIYLEALNFIKGHEKSVYGIVERSMGGSPGILTRAIYDLLEREGIIDGQTHRKHIGRYNDTGLFENYKITDETLFDMILSPGEYVDPFFIDKQGKTSGKVPDFWKRVVEKYPDALVTYLQVGENSRPFRIETLKQYDDFNEKIEMIYYSSKLLRGYAFPVGLDIVDKFAKVPNWMNAAVKKEHAIFALKKAIKSGNPKTVSLMKKMLSTKGRDWFLRPNSGRKILRSYGR